MKKALLSFMLLFVATAMSAQTTIVKGDMDGNGEVTIADVTSALNVILGKAPKEEISVVGDPYAVDNTLVVGTWYAPDGTSFTLNEDGTANYPGAATYKFRPYQGTLMFFNASGKAVKTIVLNEVEKDHMLAINYLTETYTYYLSSKHNPYDYVDLGLPSGTLWATCNVGASNPWEYGDYFAWGETETKSTYEWNTYKWCNGSENTLTKYCDLSFYGYNGFTDSKTELDPEDDAAYVNWGPAWRMPSQTQMNELCENCIWLWTTKSDVNGYEVTGPNGNSIFLPAVGFRYNSWLENTGSFGFYWSRMFRGNGTSYAYDLYFDSGAIGTSYRYRCFGQSVRPVRASE